MTTYISITVQYIKSKLFLKKLVILSLRSKNLNSKIKEINVLLNFLEIFYMRAPSYTAYIETEFHFLPTRTSISGSMVCNASVIRVIRSSTDIGRGLPSFLRSPREKSHAALGMEI